MATYWENSCSFGLRYVSWYKYLIVSLVFSHLGFWSGNLFLIAPFPDLCLLVPLYTYDFSILYTTLPHNLIKEKLLDLIEWTFKRALKNYGSLYLACNDRKAFFHFL